LNEHINAWLKEQLQHRSHKSNPEQMYECFSPSKQCVIEEQAWKPISRTEGPNSILTITDKMTIQG